MNTHLNNMDLRTLEWEHISTVTNGDKERLDIYNEIVGTIEDPCNSDYYIINNRIGSESMCGRVYKITTLNGGKIAGKIMPIFSDKNKSENANEINIAKLASDCVKNRQTTHFPLVYLGSTCGNTIFNENDPYHTLSIIYQLRKKLSKRDAILFDKKPITTIDEAKSYVSSKVGEIGDVTVETNVLLSELAWGDLKQYIDTVEINEQEMINMFKVILESIHDMQKYINVVHGDLHTGNLLLSISNRGLNLLIHDFGSSKVIENFTIKDRLFDVDTIVGKLISNHFPQGTFFGDKLFMTYQHTQTLSESELNNSLEIFEVLKEYWESLFES